jgi:hypothetical protein
MVKQWIVGALTLTLGLTSCSKKQDPYACGGPDGAPPQAQRYRPMAGSMFAPPDHADMARLCREIGISEQKISRISDIVRNINKDMNGNILNIQQEELNVRKELLKDKPDIAVIRRSIEAKTKILADVEVAQIQRDLEIKALLSADEYERWTLRLAHKMRMRLPMPLNHEMMPPPMRDAPGTRMER